MEDPSLVAMLPRLFVSLAVVFGLMALAGKLARRRGLGSTRSSEPTSRIEVLARHGLGRHASVAVVRVAGRTLVLGIGEKDISLLTDATPDTLDLHGLNLDVQQITALPSQRTALAMQTAEPSKPLDWSSFVESLKDRTARRY